MRLSFFIARRYFFSRKNPSAINIITLIGVLGYAVGSCALVVLLSALNGFEKIIFSVYENYYPDLKVTPVAGKVFPADKALVARIVKINGVKAASYVLEESAVIQNGDNQVVGLIKGVDEQFSKVVKTDSLLRAGQLVFDTAESSAWLAESLFYKMNLGSDNRSLHLMAPRRESVGVSSMEMMEKDFGVKAIIRPGDEMEQKLMVVQLEDAQELFDREGQASAMEVKITHQEVEAPVVEALQKAFGGNYDIRNRRQQNQAVYKMYNTEKWASFSIMVLVLLIISFNLVGSLSMLVLEKKRDIRILDTMGMTGKVIRRIFFSEGVMVAFAGAASGLAIGVALVLLQQKYGFITTQATFAAAYPMELRSADIVLILGLCFLLGVSAAIYPAIKSSPKR